MKKILCIDGGGMKGYIPAAILVELEKRTGKRCSEMFDLIAGTSIGGIQACLSAIGVPASTAFFTEDGPQIFQKSARGLWGLLGAKYSAAVLEEKLKNRLGFHLLSDCQCDLLVTSLDLLSQEPFFFKSHKVKDEDLHSVDYYLWKVARATSAAQTYFPAFELDDKILWDGGNVANNPAICAYCEAMKLWPGEQILMVSLGTGSQNANIKPKSLVNGALIQVGLATVQMIFEAGSEDVDYQMTQLLGDHYVRLNPALGEPLVLDDASPSGMAKLAVEAAIAVKQFCPQLTSLMPLL